MKKILILTTQIDIGAAELLDVTLSRELEAQGYSVDLMSIYSKEYAYSGNFNKNSISNISFLGLKPGFSKFLFILYVLKLAFLIHYKGYNILQTSLTGATFLGATARLFSKCGHIVGIHQVYTKKYNNSTYERLAPLLFSKKRTLFYAVSNYAKEAWVKYAKISEDRISIVYNYIDKDIVLKTSNKDSERLMNEIKINSSSKLIINVGRVCSYKNQWLVVDALKHDLIDKNIVLLFAGSLDYNVQGTKAMCRKIEQIINKFNLNRHVVFLGYQNNIDSIISNSDLLVHSTNRESFGLVLVESMLLGTPIISTNVEAIPEVLKGTRYTLVPPNDSGRLREAVLNHFEISSKKQHKMIRSGKIRAKEFTKKGKRVGEIISLIKRI